MSGQIKIDPTQPPRQYDPGALLPSESGSTRRVLQGDGSSNQAARDKERAEAQARQQQVKREAEQRFRERKERLAAEAEARKREQELRRAEFERKLAEEKAERKRRDALLSEMYKLGRFYPPFEVSTTQAQHDLDAEIVAANEAYLAIKAESERVDALRDSAKEEYRSAIRAQPRDQARIDEAAKRRKEAKALKRPTSLDIDRKQTAVARLIRMRFKAEDEAEDDAE